MPTDKDRWIVWFRDGFRCVYCGYEGTLLKTFNLGVAHKTPVSRGGKDVISNLQTACVACDSEKGDRTETEYLSYRAGRKPVHAC